MGKCVDETIGCEAPCDLRVLIHVHVIVQINEIVPQSLTKNEPSDCNQSEADIKRRESQRGILFWLTIEKLERVLLGSVLLLAHINRRESFAEAASVRDSP